ncbi:BA14K family protein [Kaistia granuli]|uniref:BA14K family protein n=1 Tax=Kaistia granuli TaxID=363259 RepID=UPI00036E3F3A|nr:BA14K family protein [Kaistia granuli]
MKKIAATALAALIGVTAIVGTAETASARDGRNAALVAGAAVGLGIGALLAAPRYDDGYEVAPPRYAAPVYDDGYRAPPPRRAIRAGWQAHADWCYDNYRSYDERTDTYVGRDGYAYRCRGSY